MNRLTRRNENGQAYWCGIDGKIFGDAIEKLAHYEDLEEECRLLKVPVAVGDTIYDICKSDNNGYRIVPMTVGKVIPYGSEYNGEVWSKVWNIYATSKYTYTYKSFYDLGRTFFLTKSEADAAIKELEKV